MINNATKLTELKRHSHYYKSVRNLETIDVYRILSLFEVNDPAVGHAVKKLLCAGGRGNKAKEQDYKEARDSICRAIEMLHEDGEIDS